MVAHLSYDGQHDKTKILDSLRTIIENDGFTIKEYIREDGFLSTDSCCSRNLSFVSVSLILLVRGDSWFLYFGADPARLRRLIILLLACQSYLLLLWMT